MGPLQKPGGASGRKVAFPENQARKNIDKKKLLVES